MSDITMPEGLTTKEIPISTKIAELININIETWDTLDETLKDQKRANSLQSNLLSNIFKKLSDEIKVSFDNEEELETTKKFYGDVNIQLNKLNKGMDTLISNSFFKLANQGLSYDDSIDNISKLQDTIINNENLTNSIYNNTTISNSTDSKDYGTTQIGYLDAIVTQFDILNKNVATIVSNPFTISPDIPRTKPEEENTNKPKNKPSPKPKQKDKEDGFFDKLSIQFDKLVGNIGKVSTNIYDKVMPTLLGPLNLITQPLTELTGINPLQSIKDGVKGLFGKKASKKPSAEEVAKGGFLGAGFLYLGNLLTRTGDESEGGLAGLFGGIKLSPDMIMKGLGIASLLAGIGLMIKDGFEGALLSEEWGVSKLSGIMGAMLGGTKSKIDGMFANAPKFALVGVGIGMVGGPVGMLLGGVIGAILGGLFGFIGGEKIAQLIQHMTDWASGQITQFITGRGVAKRLKEDTLTNADELYIAENAKEDLEKRKTRVLNDVESNKGLARQNLIDEAVNLDKQIINLQHTIDYDIKPRALANPTEINEKFNEQMQTGGERFAEGLKDGFVEFGNLFGSIFGKDTEDKGSTTSGYNPLVGMNVNDAIITKDGKVINTHEDDNIIATKNDPTQIMQIPKANDRPIVKMPDMNNYNNVSVDNNEMVDILKELLGVMRDKPMGNVVYANNGGTNLDAVRMLGVR